MQKLSLADIRDIAQYERIRRDFRAQIIALKRNRRVPVGPNLSFVFENRETMLFQVQEMMRAERIVDEAAIQQEIDTFNELIPDSGELSATMFIEFPDQQELMRNLKRLVGIEKTVSLQIGSHTSRALYEEGRSTDDKTSTVHYLKFRLTPAEINTLAAGHEPVSIVVDHPNYHGQAVLDDGVRRALVTDLT